MSWSSEYLNVQYSAILVKLLMFGVFASLMLSFCLSFCSTRYDENNSPSHPLNTDIQIELQIVKKNSQRNIAFRSYSIFLEYISHQLNTAGSPTYFFRRKYIKKTVTFLFFSCSFLIYINDKVCINNTLFAFISRQNCRRISRQKYPGWALRVEESVDRENLYSINSCQGSEQKALLGVWAFITPGHRAEFLRAFDAARIVQLQQPQPEILIKSFRFLFEVSFHTRGYKLQIFRKLKGVDLSRFSRMLPLELWRISRVWTQFE